MQRWALQLGYDEARVEKDLVGRPARWWRGERLTIGIMANNGAGGPDDADVADEARPPLVAAGAGEVVDALRSGAVVAVPSVGGYCLAVRAGSADDEAKLVALAADPTARTTRWGRSRTCAP